MNVAVDTANTFGVTVFMGCEAMTDFNTGELQKNKDGVQKWRVLISAQTLALGGRRSQLAELRVNVAADVDPCEGIEAGTPVELIGLRCDTMASEYDEDKKKLSGGQQFWQASGVRARVHAGKS